MTADPRKTTTTREQPETGWATARRLNGRGIRTCLKAKADKDGGQTRWGIEGNVVRGED